MTGTASGDEDTIRTHSPIPTPDWIVADDQPIVSVPLIENGAVVVRFTTVDSITDESAGDPAPPTILAVLRLAGAWDDLDADEVLAGLDDLRHASQPTPPVVLDER